MLIATGNSGVVRLTVHVEPLLADPSPLVRAMAVWALAQLSDQGALAAVAPSHMAGEVDAAVRAEWTRAISV